MQFDAGLLREQPHRTERRLVYGQRDMQVDVVLGAELEGLVQGLEEGQEAAVAEPRASP